MISLNQIREIAAERKLYTPRNFCRANVDFNQKEKLFLLYDMKIIKY